MSLSDDGARLAAGLDDRGEKRSGIGVWDTASGRLAAIVPPQKAAWHPQIVWIGDDRSRARVRTWGRFGGVAYGYFAS